MMLKGNKFQDERGIITYNNTYDASLVKRIYTIENASTDFIRGWQGHKIEQRWFACMSGKFRIGVIKIDDFDTPSPTLEPLYFELNTDQLDFLHIPAGNITSVQSLEENSKLLILSDYFLGEIDDEYRFPLEYFKNN
ncbi:sugar epimerase [Chryseobacterium joostei]|uniref:Sugar epimerase n=1 Tax=Chryseobacterium joostei TaxID=112234 RepID=A0A1N7I3U3_9FLAO|nr:MULTISPECIES: WxcM-like domain-containing protein [Chryseobacterium]AZA99834.1 sugar epimerase [Chryseobacterium joostei]SIS31724.1 WxcM-like, C-terminal [Chryseobacterium joostei]HCM33535.1 sugar epimerase [Chryseobacterium sp.]